MLLWDTATLRRDLPPPRAVLAGSPPDCGRVWWEPWARIQAGFSRQHESRPARTQGTLRLPKTPGCPRPVWWKWARSGPPARYSRLPGQAWPSALSPVWWLQQHPRGAAPPHLHPLQMAHRIKCWAPRGTDQRNHLGTGWDVRCMRSKRSVGTYPVKRLLLSPSDLPECQPAILCSSQRDQHGWQQRVPILSERKGEITMKSCSFTHNRHMSHPRTHLQRVGSPDTEDNDHVRHPQTGNDRNQKDTDETASWKRRDRPWFALLEFALLVEVSRGIADERDSADRTVTPTRNKTKMNGFV